MTAHRRVRKTKKQGANDDHSYAERYRAASDAAKASRTRRDEEQAPREPRIITQATLRGVSLVKVEDSPFGYSIQVGEYKEAEPEQWEKDLLESLGSDEYERSLHFKHNAVQLAEDREADYYAGWEGHRTQEALRAARSLDAAAVGEPGASGTEGQSSSEQGAEPRTPEAVLDSILEAKDKLRAEYSRQHQVFFEAEVNGLPTHVGTEQCFCEEATNHWIELGEIR